MVGLKYLAREDARERLRLAGSVRMGMAPGDEFREWRRPLEVVGEV